ncbi:MAG: cytochrome c oxidase subunit II transmembrane domain-containing protein [Planctomycetota bacterium]
MALKTNDMDTTFYNVLAEVKDAGLWFPTDAAASNQVDTLAIFILWICGFFLVFNAGLMVYFAIRYKQQKKEGAASGATHNTALEVTWSVIPAFILAIIFIWGFRGFLVQATPPDNSYDIMVTGYRWGWDFTYPNGNNSRGETDPVTGKNMVPALHVPADQPIRLTLQSNDVIHSVFIKQMRVKKDCVPGRFNQLWFEAKFDEATAKDHVVSFDGVEYPVKRNVYDLFCTEYCGQNHSMMNTKVYVYQPEDYDIWYKAMGEIPAPTPLVQLGQAIWETQCKACHNISGASGGTGPTWKDLYGDTGHATSAGPVDVDVAYITESIYNPGAKIADGYGNNMAAFPNLSPREIAGIIEFMKTVSDKAEADEGLTYGDLNVDGTLKGEGEAEGEEGTEEPEGGDESDAAETDQAAGAAD